MENKLSPQYGKALELHNKILVSAQLAQNNLWEMCAGLKEMRDGKLYRELGYKNFEDYCGTEFNMSRRNAYRYISVIENCPKENVTSGSHFGIKKLYLLSTLSESEQEKLTAENDVESMTVKQLESRIKQLKSDNDRLRNANADIAEQLNIAREDYRNVHQEKLELKKQVANLKDDIDVLESRPIEVAVAEPSDEVRQLKLTIQNLERTTEEQLDRVQEDHIKAERRLREEHQKELEQALQAQENEYRDRISELEEQLEQAGDDEMTHDEEHHIFEVYRAAAHDALFNLIGFAAHSTDKTSCFSSIKTLLIEFQEANDDLIYGRN